MGEHARLQLLGLGEVPIVGRPGSERDMTTAPEFAIDSLVGYQPLDEAERLARRAIQRPGALGPETLEQRRGPQPSVSASRTVTSTPYWARVRAAETPV
jgi:hypothetical protein